MLTPRPIRPVVRNLLLVATSLVLTGCGSDDSPAEPEPMIEDPPVSEDCFDYGSLAVEVARYSDGGFIGSAALRGDHVIVASSVGLHALRHEEGQVLSLVDQLDMYALAVRTRGDLAYVASDSEIRVVDVSTPSNMREKASLIVEEKLRLLEVGTRYAVAASVSQLYVIGIVDPERPLRIATLDLMETIYDIELSGDLVFAVTDTGLRVISIAIPSRPAQIGRLTANRMLSVDASENLVALFGAADVVKVVDVTDPTRPMEAGSWDLVATAEASIGISPSRVYLETPDGVFLLGHENGQNLRELGFTPHPTSIPWDLFVEGGRLYLSGGDLQVLDVPEETERPDPTPISADDFRYVVAAGDLLFGTSGDRLLGFDLSDPDAPNSLFEQVLPEPATAIAYTEGSVWVGTATGLIEVTVDSASVALGRTADLGARVDALAARGGFAYLSRGSEFVVVDLSTEDLSVVGTTAAIWPGDELEIAGDVAFLYRRRWGFEAFDIGTPASPASMRAHGFSPDPSGFAAGRSGAFLAAGIVAELRIVGLEAEPVPTLSSTSFRSDIRDLVFYGDVLYASTTHRIEVLEVVDGADPKRVGAWPLRGGTNSATRMIASGNHLILWTPQGLERLPAHCATR